MTKQSLSTPPRPHDNCYWLAPHFLAGEYPGVKTDEAAVHGLGPILDAGVTFFLDLTEPDELEPYEPLLAATVASHVPRRSTAGSRSATLAYPARPRQTNSVHTF